MSLVKTDESTINVGRRFVGTSSEPAFTASSNLGFQFKAGTLLRGLFGKLTEFHFENRAVYNRELRLSSLGSDDGQLIERADA